MIPESNQGLSVLRLPDVMVKTGRSRAWIYAKISSGEFPAPIKLGAGATASGWVSSEVDSWIAEQIARRDKGGDQTMVLRTRKRGTPPLSPMRDPVSTPKPMDGGAVTHAERVAPAGIH